jgi:asparagine synthase (glutamine-hydrolysing)
MCGIAGFIDFSGKSKLVDLRNMISVLNHRGPDDMGMELVQNDKFTIGLSQARLSIIDLSQGGHQPMIYKHYYIIFNGEIYNYNEIKRELIDSGSFFTSESDTEVILHAFDKWGIDCINRFIGMFAFVIYNNISNEVVIVRDRSGIKPLYYFWHNDIFLFASELKALHMHFGFEKKIDQTALQQYFSQVHHGYIPAPNTIFENTYKVKSGNFMNFNLITKELKSSCYWDVNTFYRLPKLKHSYSEAKENMHQLIKSACEYRMVSDVPVGVFLSGGYDSTLVTSILQSNRKEKINTFTIGFEEGNNEIPFAKQTAEFLGTEHHEFVCTKKEAQEIIPQLPYFYDEPFADSSAIPTLLVSKFAREFVTVALSADAGDEVFCGYSNYMELNTNLRRMNYIPDILKSGVSNIGEICSRFIPDIFGTTSHKLF